MYKTHYRSGRGTVWIAYFIVIVSALFIVMIVNRNALSPIQTNQSGQASLTDQTALIEEIFVDIPVPAIEVSVPTAGYATTPENIEFETTVETVRLPMPTINVDVAYANVTLVKEHRTKKGQALVPKDDGTQSPPSFQVSFAHSLDSPTYNSLLLTQATSIFASLSPQHPKTIEDKGVSDGVFDTSPSLVVLERSNLAKPIPLPSIAAQVTKTNPSALHYTDALTRLEDDLSSHIGLEETTLQQDGSIPQNARSAPF